MSSSTSTSALKARHYNALGNALRQLQNGLQNSEYQMDRLSDHLRSMQKLGTHSAAQFMAVSRLLDKELNDLNELEMQRRIEEEKVAEQAADGQTEQARQ